MERKKGYRGEETDNYTVRKKRRIKGVEKGHSHNWGTDDKAEKKVRDSVVSAVRS